MCALEGTKQSVAPPLGTELLGSPHLPFLGDNPQLCTSNIFVKHLGAHSH